MLLQPFHGGVRLPPHKPGDAAPALHSLPLPPELVHPLPPPGASGACAVTVGQRVRRGEMLAAAADARGAAVHAGSSGTVTAIAPRPVGDGEATCVVIATDGRDDSAPLPPLADWRELPRERLLERLAVAGVVGLGGAAFPAAAKLAAPGTILILNGAECEPWLRSDEALLCHGAVEVLAAAQLLAHLCRATRVLLALESRMHGARAALQAALAAPGAGGVELVAVPTRYPVGSERQLIRVLTGQEVPSGGLPRDLDVSVHNVASAVAAWRAIVHGEALTERLVTLGGRGVRGAGVYRVRLGTPVAHLVAHAGGYTDAAARLVLGGPMMGQAVAHDAVPVLASTQAVLVLGADELRAAAPERACIRCGDCAAVCPAQLLPQTLLAQLREGELEAAAQQGLSDCIECGACAWVCPAQIPLVQLYRDGKSALQVQEDERARAVQARARHLARAARLARDAAERVARVAARAPETAPAAAQPAATAPATPAAAATTAAAPMDKAAVLAAIARGRARRQAAAPAGREDAP